MDSLNLGPGHPREELVAEMRHAEGPSWLGPVRLVEKVERREPDF